MTAAESTTVPSPAPAAVRLPPDDGPVSRRRLLVRRVLWGALAVSFVVTCAITGLPTDRISILSWVLAALAVHTVADGWRRLGRLLADWLPLAAALMGYDATRGLADRIGVPVHVTEPAAVDRWLGGGTLPTVWLQQHLGGGPWEVVATLVYSSHFVVTPVVLGVFWIRDRARWARYARLVIALSLAGLVTYVLYPAAPPWLAAKDGAIESVDRLSGSGWAVLGLPRAGALLSNGQGHVNRVAAIPSLHTAFAVLTCLVLLPLARRVWQRVVLVGYALLMPLALVWAGEHYVVDTVLGAAYAVGLWLLLPRVERLVRRGLAARARGRGTELPSTA